jgi:pimeloyl-ACP methyl ester carboxylesterase
MSRIFVLGAGLATALALAGGALASGTVGTSFPAGFPAITDASLGTPVIGFGAAGRVTRTPVIFLHGNNDTPFPTACNPFGYVHNLAQYFADHGYAPSELWGLGYQGDQCDLIASPTNRSGDAHSTVANVPDLDRFVRAVLAYTGAKRVDIVGHSLGVTLAREWMRADHAAHLVRRLVAIDGPNHGIVNCSPSPFNYFQLVALGGFTPDSAICREYGAADTPLLTALNRGNESKPTKTLVIRNADTSFVYFSKQDGPFFPPVPAEDSHGNPHDFSHSAELEGAQQIDLVGQGAYDPILGTAHLGILNSPQTWQAALDFLQGDADD